MKNGAPCPKCDSEEIYLVDEALIPHPKYSNAVLPLTLSAHYGPTGEMGFLGGEKSDRVLVRVEASVCAACGFSELYAKDLDVLARLAREGAGHVRRR